MASPDLSPADVPHDSQPTPKRVLIALPDRDFEPTEAAVPWRALVDSGAEVRFATPDGKPAEADPHLLTGVVFGKLGATKADLVHYEAMVASEAFQQPLSYDQIDVAQLDALVLPGGHAQGIRPYLESEVLQARSAEALLGKCIVGAICHGVLILARATNAATGQSVIADRAVTTLPKYLERLGYFTTAWKHGRYYRTYPAYTEAAVRASLQSGGQFQAGPLAFRSPFALRDGNLVTARWPGDSALFGKKLVQALAERRA